MRRNRIRLELTEPVAQTIEDEVLLPYRLHQENMAEYEAVLREEIVAENPLSDRTLAELKDLQKLLGLTDGIVEAIFEKCLGGESASSSICQTDLGNGIFLDMVRIPAGEFWMGAAENEEDAQEREYPRHRVKVSEFWMGKFTVTQAQWAVVAKLPKVKLDLEANPSRFEGADRPVERVSWFEAVEFCARISQKMGNTYRLPSEAEWEYACRAGTETPFHFGKEISSNLANYDINREATIDVGSFAPNDFGLYDMHGNVWEWCMDDWHGNYQGAPDDGSVWVDSVGTAFAKVLRGGSWGNDPRDCRSAFRNLNDPGLRIDGFGFRVMCCAPRALA